MSDPGAAQALSSRILEGTAAQPLRAAAARGALPLPRAMLAHLYLHLRADPDEAIRATAEQSLRSLGPDEVREILSDGQCTREVLAYFAARAVRDETLAEIVAFHPAASQEVLSVLASQGSPAVVDLVLTNEERLLASPALLDRLAANPGLRPHQRGRILDLLDRIAKSSPAVDAVEAEPADAGPATPEEAARLLEVDVGELFAASEILDGDEFANSEDPVVRSVYRKILTLNTAQKALLAMKGGREERLILVRDTNKVVSLSVLKNPRLGEQEAAGIAAMRNVSDEVLRSLGGSREWQKSYSVVSALVRNPRTPPGISMNFVPRLVTKDLKILAMDKNVPEIIRRNAKRTYELRTQKDAPSFRKK